MSNKIIQKLCLCLMIVIMTMFISSVSMAATTEEIKVTGNYNYTVISEVLNLVNAERAKQGLGALKFRADLINAADQRAAENAVLFSHTRPDGTSYETVLPKMNAWGENLAVGQRTAAEVVNSWMNSKPHRENILRSNFDAIGISCFTHNNTIYWVQLFGTMGNEKEPTSLETSGAKQKNVKVSSEDVSYSAKNANINLETGKPQTLTVLGADSKNIASITKTFICDGTSFTWTTDNANVATVNKGVVTAKSAGTTVITASNGGKSVKFVVVATGDTNNDNSNNNNETTNNGNNESDNTNNIAVLVNEEKPVKITASVALNGTNGKLVVKDIKKDTSNYKTLSSKVQGMQVVAAYDVSIEGEYSENIKLRFEIGNEHNGKDVVLLHKKSNAAIERFKGKVENGAVSVTVSELSPFMIAVQSTKTDLGTLDNSPETGEVNNIMPIYSIVIISVAGLMLISKRK